MTEDQLAELACAAGLEIDPAHAPGVLRNLEILQGQAALLLAAPLDPLIEPAPVFVP
jgi:hypothetical protein